MFSFLRSGEPWIETLRENLGKEKIILIPGTWGHGKWNVIVKSRLPSNRNALPCFDAGQWFDPDGPIAKEFGLQDFGVRILRWSERNSVPDRLRAAEKLKEHLERALDAEPDSVVSIIAHSHGGNVAALAFAQMEESERLHRIRLQP
jgi:hypothetical protein